MRAAVPFFELRWNAASVFVAASSAPAPSAPEQTAQQYDPKQDEEENGEEREESETKSPPRPYNNRSCAAGCGPPAFGNCVRQSGVVGIISNSSHSCDREKPYGYPKYGFVTHVGPPNSFQERFSQSLMKKL